MLAILTHVPTTHDRQARSGRLARMRLDLRGVLTVIDTILVMYDCCFELTFLKNLVLERERRNFIVCEMILSSVCLASFLVFFSLFEISHLVFIVHIIVSLHNKTD